MSFSAVGNGNVVTSKFTLKPDPKSKLTGLQGTYSLLGGNILFPDLGRADALGLAGSTLQCFWLYQLYPGTDGENALQTPANGVLQGLQLAETAGKDRRIRLHLDLQLV